jgi:hypothetical protein
MNRINNIFCFQVSQYIKRDFLFQCASSLISENYSSSVSKFVKNHWFEFKAISQRFNKQVTSNQLINYINKQNIIKTKKKLESSWILSCNQMHCQCATIMSKKLRSFSSIINRFASWIYAMIDINYNNSIENHRIYQIQKLRWESRIMLCNSCKLNWRTNEQSMSTK